MVDDRQAPVVSRRSALKLATAAIGGAIGAVLAVPLVRTLLHPIGRRVVSMPTEPIDVLDEAELEAGAPPVKVRIVASNVRDAWTVASDVAVGAAWLSRRDGGEVVAFSAACPHLGCSVTFDQDRDVYRCPCHKSAFARSGDRVAGPSKRGLDPLDVVVEEGRIKVVFRRFKSDISGREEV